MPMSWPQFPWTFTDRRLWIVVHSYMRCFNRPTNQGSCTCMMPLRCWNINMKLPRRSLMLSYGAWSPMESGKITFPTQRKICLRPYLAAVPTGLALWTRLLVSQGNPKLLSSPATTSLLGWSETGAGHEEMQEEAEKIPNWPKKFIKPYKEWCQSVAKKGSSCCVELLFKEAETTNLNQLMFCCCLRPRLLVCITILCSSQKTSSSPCILLGRLDKSGLIIWVKCERNNSLSQWFWKVGCCLEGIERSPVLAWIGSVLWRQGKSNKF